MVNGKATVGACLEGSGCGQNADSLHARSLAPLEKTRGFGMTQLGRELL